LCTSVRWGKKKVLVGDGWGWKSLIVVEENGSFKKEKKSGWVD